MGKAKARLSANSILKNKFDKDNFFKKYMGKHCSKTKLCRGNTVAIHIVFFFKKTTKLNSQPT